MIIEEILDIELNKQSTVTLHRQLYQYLMQAIISGRIAAATRLPASRVLAEQLQVSRNTVQAAYEQLKAEGYLASKQGAGIFVSAQIPDRYCYSSDKIDHDSENYSEKIDNAGGGFCPGIPALDLFPHKKWASLCHKVLRQHYHDLLHAKHNRGYLPLREAIALHLRQARSVKCDPEQVIITAGAQEAINITMRTLFPENEQGVIALENPGYRNAYYAAKSNYARILSVPVTKEGVDLEKLKSKPRSHLIYVTPSHQYPLCATLPISKRLDLIGYAHRKKSFIIEDDYDSEFHYQVKPLPSLQGLDQYQRVIYLGTFSKTLFPALRIGFLVVPKNLIQRFQTVKMQACGQTALFNQVVLTEFINTGEFSRHLKRMRLHYAENYKKLVSLCRHHLSDDIIIHESSVGLHISLVFPNYIDDHALVAELNKQQLYPQPLSDYYYGPHKKSGLVIGFGNIAFEKIEAAVKKLAAIVN